MLLSEPPPSPYDVRLRLFGVPVRISPYFWIVALVMGLNPSGGTRPVELILWIAVVLVSILVHEFGHAAMQRWFGGRPWITLYALGGLASCDDCDRRPSSQILISLAGPVAGFLLAALVVAALAASGRVIEYQWSVLPVRWNPFDVRSLAEERQFGPPDLLIINLLFVNILWGLVNLLPIYPLDGGRIAREVCTLRSPRAGIVLSLRISMLAAIAMAAVAALAWQSLFTTLMFGYLAYSSYATLQAYEAQRW